MASTGAITAPHITQTAKSKAKLISQLRSELLLSIFTQGR